MTLNEVSQGRKNNLDFIRFIAAVMVIYSHAFPLSLGEEQTDFLSIITNQQIGFGSLGVSVFFLYGGFLIARSTIRLKYFKEYFKARIIRIFPCLFIVTIFLAFILGPILTEVSVVEYFKSLDTYKYVLNAILILKHNLPGVFEDNIYGATVNGPLWTLPLEFSCYIICFLIYKIGFLNKKFFKYTLLPFAVIYVILNIQLGNNILQSAMRPMGLFYLGIIYYVYREDIILRKRWVIISVLGLLLTNSLNLLEYGILLFLPYILLYIGFETKKKILIPSKFGEPSYGMYLIGWPIQQVLVQIYGGSMNPYINFLITLPIDIIFGYILFKYVDQPILNYRKKEKYEKNNNNTVL